VVATRGREKTKYEVTVWETEKGEKETRGLHIHRLTDEYRQIVPVSLVLLIFVCEATSPINMSHIFISDVTSSTNIIGQSN
jgi:hypothetical protein